VTAERVPLNIALVGATGNVGAKIRDEALTRGHSLTALVRDVAPLPPDSKLTAHSVDTKDVAALAQALSGHDVVVVSVRWNSNDIAGVLQAVRGSGVERVVIVIGAGSLTMPDGRLFFEHNLDKGIDPPTSRAALGAYRHLQEVQDVNWTAVSPAAQIEPGERTGTFRIGGDALMFDASGQSRISQEDFAIAILDEVEQPRHPRGRFSVAY
jgi:putative NADH-flavin reductase